MCPTLRPYYLSALNPRSLESSGGQRELICKFLYSAHLTSQSIGNQFELGNAMNAIVRLGEMLLFTVVYMILYDAQN